MNIFSTKMLIQIPESNLEFANYLENLLDTYPIKIELIDNQKAKIKLTKKTTMNPFDESIFIRQIIIDSYAENDKWNINLSIPKGHLIISYFFILLTVLLLGLTIYFFFYWTSLFVAIGSLILMNLYVIMMYSLELKNWEKFLQKKTKHNTGYSK